MFYKTLQFCYCKVNIYSVAQYSSVIFTNRKVLMDLLGLSQSDADSLIKMNKVFQHKETEQIVESYHFCKKIGFSNEDLLRYPSLLTTHPLVKYQHYKSLEDSGFKPIDAKLLCGARMYKRKKIIFLKAEGYLESSANLADRFLTYLDPPIKKPKELDKNLRELDSMTWLAVHMKILVEWLKVRLNATDDDMIKLFRIHKMIQGKSFRVINENITMAESLGMSHQKILKSGYILNNYPEYPKTVLKEFPGLCGLDMGETMKKNPKLMMVAPKKIMMIYGILKEFDIPDSYIRRKHQVFCMNTDTLRYRLEEVTRVPEFRALMRYPRFLDLVVHHKHARSRLTFLQNLQLKCASFTLLGSLSKENGTFDNHIKEGRDVNAKIDAKIFFSSLFGKDRKEVKKKLDVHPYCCHVPYIDIQATYDYLSSIGYTKKNIYSCLVLLLYPKSKIEKAIECLRNEKDVDFIMLSQSKQLNLVLYHIEKGYHFTGNGIWNDEGLKESTFGIPEEKTLE